MASLPLGSVWASLFAASSLAVGSAAPADDRRPAMGPPSSKNHNNVGVPASGGSGSCRALAEMNAKTGRRSMSRRRHERCWRPNRPPRSVKRPGAKRP
jgi:hypothetical protein